MGKVYVTFLIIGLIITPMTKCLDQEILNRIDEMAESILACRDIVGMNLAIVEGEETVYTKGYGVVDLEANSPVTPQTLFGVASVTKQFATTALALVLEEKGQVFIWYYPSNHIF